MFGLGKDEYDTPERRAFIQQWSESNRANDHLVQETLLRENLKRAKRIRTLAVVIVILQTISFALTLANALR